MRNIRMSEPSVMDSCMPAALSISLGWWAIVDARRMGYSIPMLAKAWLFLFAVVVVPLYVVWSRQRQGVGWVVLHATFWYLLSAIAMNVGVVLLGYK